MTTLKSFGCSFIFGSDLDDEIPGKKCSNLTWPALLAQDKNCNYQCYAYPGAGNLQILESLLNHLDYVESTIYVIGWSWIDRFDYTSPTTKKWVTILPTDSDTSAKFYYKNLHSQYRDNLTTLMYIKLAIDTLKSKNVRFIMTYIDDLIFEDRWYRTPAVKYLQNYIKPYLTNFDGDTFLNWSLKNNYSISPLGKHPLDTAHRHGFELIKSYNLV
jgi:hypothetical protein